MPAARYRDRLILRVPFDNRLQSFYGIRLDYEAHAGAIELRRNIVDEFTGGQ
jgi:hypothetical protein